MKTVYAARIQHKTTLMIDTTHYELCDLAKLTQHVKNSADFYNANVIDISKVEVPNITDIKQLPPNI